MTKPTAKEQPTGHFLGSETGRLTPGRTFSDVGWEVRGVPAVGKSLNFYPRPEFLDIDKVQDGSEETHLRLIEPLGRRLYLRYIHKTDSLEVIEPKSSPLLQEEIVLKPLIGLHVRSSRYTHPADDDVLAERRTLMQVTASHNFKAGNSDRVLVNIRAANLYAIRHADHLTMEDLEEINRLVNKDNLPENSLYPSGMIKGFAYRHNDQLFDLTEYRNFGYNEGGSAVFEYLHPSLVPGEVKAFLDSVNHLTPKSPLSRALAVYQNLVVQHLFVDGNGRTSRVLLDYALAKIGAPPFPHSAFKPHPFFVSQHEIEVFYRAYYGLPIR